MARAQPPPPNTFFGSWPFAVARLPPRPVRNFPRLLPSTLPLPPVPRFRRQGKSPRPTSARPKMHVRSAPPGPAPLPSHGLDHVLHPTPLLKLDWPTNPATIQRGPSALERGFPSAQAPSPSPSSSHNLTTIIPRHDRANATHMTRHSCESGHRRAWTCVWRVCIYTRSATTGTQLYYGNTATRLASILSDAALA